MSSNDFYFITGVEITTHLNQEASARNVFSIKEATIPSYEVAEKEPLPKNVTQNNERIFSNISKVFGKNNREKQLKYMKKTKTEAEGKFSKINKEKSVFSSTTQLVPLSRNKAFKLKPISFVNSTKKIEQEWKEFFEGPINKSIISNFFWYTLCAFKELEETRKGEEKFIESSESKKIREKSENWRSREKLTDRDSRKFSSHARDMTGNDRRNSSKAYLDQLRMTQNKLLDNIAGNYIELNLQSKSVYKDKFFQIYYDCLAQAVFYCYFFAYPQSRNDIVSEEFMNFVFTIISTQITGMPICNRGFEDWSFDLGAGNILEKGKIKKSTLPALAGLSDEGIDKSNHLLHMRYSPLVNRFMKNRKYEGYNVVNDWKMRYTLRNPKQVDIDSKMKDYTRLAMNTVKNTHDRFNKYEEESKKIDDEIARNKAYIQKVTALMEERTKAILKHNSREYANLLVSLRGEWPTHEGENV